MKLIKTFLLIILLTASFKNLNAQGKKKKSEPSRGAESGDKCFNENTRIVNIGIGFGGINYYGGFYGSGYIYKESPAISLSYEQAVPKKLGPGYLGIGVYLGFQTASSTLNYNNYLLGPLSNYYSTWKWTNYMITARGAYHPDFLNWKKGEVYGGVLIGLRIQTYSFDTNVPSNSPFTISSSSGGVFPTFSLYVGGRYYFTKNIGVFGELGYGISYFNAGLSFKF